MRADCAGGAGRLSVHDDVSGVRVWPRAGARRSGRAVIEWRARNHGQMMQSSRAARPAGRPGRARPARPEPDRRASDSRHRPPPCRGPKIGSGHCPHARREDGAGTARPHPATSARLRLPHRATTSPTRRAQGRSHHTGRRPHSREEHRDGHTTPGDGLTHVKSTGTVTPHRATASLTRRAQGRLRLHLVKW